jgi:hypothetical protein
MDPRREARSRILTAFGAAGPMIEELLLYSDAGCWQVPRIDSTCLPLNAELHVAAWRTYAAEAVTRGAWEVLRARLPQLQFPVCAGISQTEVYRAATRRGEALDASQGAARLELRSPDRLRLWVHDCLAGPIPVLCTGDRDDFVLLVQALSSRNEPEPVPDSMGACVVSGFNNWDRFRQYREQWLRETAHPLEWDAEFRRIIPHKELYQDRFLILVEGPYSSVSAEALGLPADEWQRLSLSIRLTHECTHYLTLRLFGAMRTHALDEVIADYVGIATACGRYRADWFLRFVGLEEFPTYRPGGRLENYRGQPPLSDAAFTVLQKLVHAAAMNLERHDSRYFPDSRAGQDRSFLVPTLYQMTLEELATSDVLQRTS